MTRASQAQTAIAIVLASATLLSGASARADSVPEAERTRRAAVVVRVADRTVTLGELESRLGALPRFQLAEFGATAAEVKKGFVEKIVVPELLLEVAGDKRDFPGAGALARRLSRTRSNATLRAVRQQVPAPDRLAAEEVKAYYESHKAQYDAPEKVAVWRILVATKEEALAVIAAAKKDLTVAAFTTLAREKSVDKATNLRAGNLGFLTDDGISNEAGLRVEPAIVRAAKTVKDGELVQTPVEEGTHGFAIVWRRGTVPPIKRTLAESDEQIRAVLVRRIADDLTAKLLADLKKDRVGPIDTELVRTVALPSFLDVTPRK